MGSSGHVCFGAQKDESNLKALYDGHRWFALRDSVTRGGTPAFYQGAVACMFNDVRRCEKEMTTVIKANPQSDDAVRAHQHLASAYLIHGKYREVLAQTDAVLAVRPGDSDAANDRSFIATLAEFPDQEVVHRAHSTLNIQEAGLPLSINSARATYWFDTGANYSRWPNRKPDGSD